MQLADQKSLEETFELVWKNCATQLLEETAQSLEGAAQLLEEAVQSLEGAAQSLESAT